jgi:hypothetical protein
VRAHHDAIEAADKNSVRRFRCHAGPAGVAPAVWTAVREMRERAFAALIGWAPRVNRVPA